MKEQPLEEVVYFVMDRAMKRVKQYSAQAFQQHGFDLTIDQWVLLKRIGEVNGINQIEIAQSTYKDPASVTRILEGLRKKGLIEKKVNQIDRRRFDIHLTETGKSLFEKMIDLVVELRKIGIQGIPKAELDQMTATLNKIYKNVDHTLE